MMKKIVEQIKIFLIICQGVGRDVRRDVHRLISLIDYLVICVISFFVKAVKRVKNFLTICRDIGWVKVGLTIILIGYLAVCVVCFFAFISLAIEKL